MKRVYFLKCVLLWFGSNLSASQRFIRKGIALRVSTWKGSVYFEEMGPSGNHLTYGQITSVTKKNRFKKPLTGGERI